MRTSSIRFQRAAFSLILATVTIWILGLPPSTRRRPYPRLSKTPTKLLVTAVLIADQYGVSVDDAHRVLLHRRRVDGIAVAAAAATAMNRWVRPLICVSGFAVTLFGLACSDGDAAESLPTSGAPWLESRPPLATFDALADDGSEDVLLAGTDGVLEITGDCVLLHTPYGPTFTAAWTEGRVAMSAESNAILFLEPTLNTDPFDGKPELLTLRSGASLVVGGYSRSPSEKLIFDYVKPPHPSCPKDMWHIQTVVLDR